MVDVARRKRPGGAAAGAGGFAAASVLAARARPIIIGAAAVILLTSAQAFADLPESPAPMARVHHACAIVMGLPQPGELYDTCVRSLNESLSELDQARLVSTGRITCAKEGTRPGMRAFADCVLDDETSAANGFR
jgi:hypothetical protein